MADEWRETGGTASAHVSFGTLGGEDPMGSPHPPSLGSRIREHSEGVWLFCGGEGTLQSHVVSGGQQSWIERHWACRELLVKGEVASEQRRVGQKLRRPSGTGGSNTAPSQPERDQPGCGRSSAGQQRRQQGSRPSGQRPHSNPSRLLCG